MYTNIRTGPALTHISHLLRQEAGRTFHHYDTQALIEAIELVFTNNILQFGDTYWQQISEQAWALPPPPHGPPFITPFTKTGSFHVGPQMSSCTVGSSTTLSASGYVTPALNTTTPSGHSSKRTCNNGTA
eukprot:CCRYP_020135-RB/>CCRYP_020135-RB protein AED:0.38 eAED:0.38 QI:0/-1/0/1/-1/0/1/0/129